MGRQLRHSVYKC